MSPDFVGKEFQVGLSVVHVVLMEIAWKYSAILSLWCNMASLSECHLSGDGQKSGLHWDRFSTFLHVGSGENRIILGNH